ncbi:hypothetical protein [Microbacterium timonense]|uniref:hypothetical protein n=1 Tax=Microbacterium timonense TaxID=2086576 RepID=UPI000D10035C|nr:hypothetical protein [Microbacterium timonense]
MKIPAQLVNLLGIVVIAAILLAGVALIALPLYGQAQATDSETRTVSQTNDIYVAQVTQLQTDADRMPQISADVETLRRGIPVIPQLDDVHELVGAAATETGAVVVSTVMTDLVPWTPRTDLGAILGEDGATAAAPEQPSAAETPDAAAGENGAPPADETSAPATDSGGDGSSPQQQVTATIEVEVTDAAQAAAFIDALGAGPRLLAIGSSVLTKDDDGPLKLIVTAYAFLRTEN